MRRKFILIFFLLELAKTDEVKCEAYGALMEKLGRLEGIVELLQRQQAHVTTCWKTCSGHLEKRTNWINYGVSV